MKLNRRGFFGAAAGAVAAAPGLATTAKNSFPSAAINSGAAAGINFMGKAEAPAQNIARLVKIARGGRDIDRLRDAEMYGFDGFGHTKRRKLEIHGLKSVSPAYRERMREDAEQRATERRWQMQAVHELTKVLGIPVDKWKDYL